MKPGDGGVGEVGNDIVGGNAGAGRTKSWLGPIGVNGLEMKLFWMVI